MRRPEVPTILQLISGKAYTVHFFGIVAVMPLSWFNDCHKARKAVEMKSSKQIGEEIAALQAKVNAIQAVATEDSRELTSEEQTEIDGIVGVGDKPGQIEALSKDRERAIRIESLVSNSVRQSVDSQSSNPENKSIKIPARARATRELVAFKGADAETEAFKAGKFFQAYFGNKQARQWCEDHGVYNTMTTGDDLAAGTLVTPEFETAVIRLVESYGVIPRYARVRNMASDVLSVPRRISGMTAYAVGEASEITTTEPNYAPINLVARKWATLTRISSELNDDAVISIADEIAIEAAQGHALAADQAGFLGDGTGTYHGVVGLANALNAGAIATAATGNTDATTTIAVFQAAAGKLPEFPGINPVWFVSKPVFWNVMARLQLAAGGNNYVDLGAGPVLQFLGYPVVFSQVLPKTIGSSTKFCYFGDLAMASTLGMRRSLTLASDPSRYFERDEIAFRSTMRWDYVVHERGSASESGPIVSLVSAA